MMMVSNLSFFNVQGSTDPAEKWKEYEPNVLDLDKVEASVQFLVSVAAALSACA